MSVHNLNEVSTESRHLRTVSAGECQPRYNDGVATIEGSNGRILMRKPVREHYSNNGMVLPRPNSEYISPGEGWAGKYAHQGLLLGMYTIGGRGVA